MKVKELLVYIYKLPISEGRPSLRWVQTGRWFYLRRESSLRFRNAIGYLNRVECPMTEYEKGYLVLKISPVKEKLIVMVPDLIFDAIITPTKIEGIWEQLWTVSAVKPDENLLALWQIGKNTKSTQNLKEVKELYKKLLEELNKSKEGSKV